MSARIIVTGGRAYWERETVWDALDTLSLLAGGLTVINGGAPGADKLARIWSWAHDLPPWTVQADWARYGKAAGPIRNAEMIECRPALVLAFPGGRGTQDMINKAKAAGIDVLRRG